MAQVTITQIPHLNTAVIKQNGVRLFVAAPDSVVIGKTGYLLLLEQMLRGGFLTPADLVGVMNKVIGTGENDENQEDGNSTD